MSKTTFKTHGYKIALEDLTPDAKTKDGAWSFEVRPGGWIIATRKTANQIERKRFFAWEGKGKSGGTPVGANLGGVLYHGELSQKIRATAGSSGGDADLVAQFPGKVRKILVQEGANVQEGTPLVLVEAMKMEFQVKAPADGTIKKILVKEGQQLSPGDRFVDFAMTPIVENSLKNKANSNE